MLERTFLLAGLLAASLSAQQSAAPQRTMTSPPDSAQSADQKSGASAAVLERYRQAWQRMTPAQQKAMVNAGGYTPEQYERMLKQQGGGPGTQIAGPLNGSGNDAGPTAFESLSKSLRDLNAIRDGNLSLVQKDGCAPELASRIADLKGKLQSYEFELNGTDASGPPAANAPRTDKSGPADPLALAADWFKKGPSDQPPAAAAAPRGNSRESKLLEAALADTEAAEHPRRIDPKSPDAERKRKAIEEDMTRVKVELEQLSGACATAKK